MNRMSLAGFAVLWFVVAPATGCDCGGGAETDGSALRLDTVEPGSGPTAGGTPVELRGAGFTGDVAVFLADRPATEVEVLGPGVLRAVTPAGERAGAVDVRISRGEDEASLEGAFEYLDGPRVDSVEPGWGSVEGGTAVVVHGAGFAEGATLRFGSGEATEVQWVDAETLGARTPPGAPGLVDVLVTNPDGQSGSLRDGFEYRVPLRCRPAESDPVSGQADVGVIDPLHIAWTLPVAATSLEGRVSLRSLNPEEADIPVAVAADGDSAATITPDRSLRFWRTYLLSIAEGVTADDGSPCEPAAIAFSTVVPQPGTRALRPASADGLVVLGSYAITASQTYRGLQVYDISDPSNVRLAREVLTRESPANLTALGDRLYAPAGLQGVLIFDVADPAEPVAIGHAGTPGTAQDVAAFERAGRQYIAVADGTEGVRILDVTDAEGIIDLGAIDPSGERDADVRAVDVQGDWLAIADGTLGFDLVDLSNLDDPIVVGHNWLGFPSTDVAIAGDILYVAHGVQGLYSVDLSLPDTLPWIHEQFGPDGPCADYCVDEFASITLTPSGDELIAAAHRSGVFRISLDGAGGMELAGSVQTAGLTTRALVSGEHIFAVEDAGLVVYTAQVQPGDPPTWLDPDGHGLARVIAVVDDHAYAAAGTRGLQTFSLSDPSAPLLIDRDDTPGAQLREYGAFSVAALPDVLALADGRGGLTLFDLTDPANPVEAGNLPAEDRVSQMVASGSTLFACADNWGVLVADISQPSSPVAVGALQYQDDPRDQCYDLLLDGDRLVVASRLQLTIADVSDPTTPIVVSAMPLRGSDAVTHISLSGSYLLAATSVTDFEGRLGTSHRLQVFDLSQGAEPERVWISDDLGGAAGMALARDILFLAAGDIGLYVFDVHEPSQPVLEGLIELPGWAGKPAAGLGALYVAQLQGGVQAVRTGLLPR